MDRIARVFSVLAAANVAAMISLSPATAWAGPPEPIYGGTTVAPCGWPSAVSLGGCTGTLVHPEVVVTAAHCVEGGGPDTIAFGDRDDAPAFEVPVTSCAADPEYGAVGGHDVAYCKLATPVTTVPIVPILMGCETDVLVPGAQVVAVGFGEANDGLGFGPKRQVSMTLNSIADGEAFIGGNGKDTCYGDSGGPVFVPIADGTWRVFGITSYGDYCGGGGYYSMMHTAVDWLEQSTGIDLTPCFDHGTWAPGPGCGAFPLDPAAGGGAWQSACGNGQLSPPSASCGPAFDAGPSDPSGGGSGGADPTPPPASGGSSGATGPAIPGCASASSCESCAGCIAECTCLTGDAIGCQTACKPLAGAPPSASPSPAPSFRTNEASDASSGCSLAPRRSSPLGSAIFLLLTVIGMTRRRQDGEPASPDDTDEQLLEISSSWLATVDDIARVIDAAPSDEDLDDVTKRMASTLPPARPRSQGGRVLQFPRSKPLPPLSPLPERPSRPLAKPSPIPRRALPPIRPLPPKPAPPADYDESCRPSVIPVTGSVRARARTECVWNQPLVKRAAAYGAITGAFVFGVSLAIRLATHAPAASEARGATLLVTASGPAGGFVPEVAVAADGITRCNSTPCIVPLEKGTHFVSATAPGFTPTAPRAVQIENGRDATLHIDLWPRAAEPETPPVPRQSSVESEPEVPPAALPPSPPPPPPRAPVKSALATLNLNAIPIAHVVVDGRPLGFTPKVGVRVAAGEHRVLFSTSDGRRQEQAVDLDPGAARTVAVRF